MLTKGEISEASRGFFTPVLLTVLRTRVRVLELGCLSISYGEELVESV